MSFFDTTPSQRTLIILASVPVVVRTVVMYFYAGTNPLQGSIPYLLLLSALTITSIYVYFRITV